VWIPTHLVLLKIRLTPSMKRYILYLIVTVGLIVSASAQTTLFQDDFSGTSVDTSKWSVNTIGYGSVTQGNGILSFNHPSGSSKANITTVSQFNQPFTISGSFNVSSNGH